MCHALLFLLGYLEGEIGRGRCYYRGRSLHSILPSSSDVLNLSVLGLVIPLISSSAPISQFWIDIFTSVSQLFSFCDLSSVWEYLELELVLYSVVELLHHICVIFWALLSYS